MPLIRTIVTLPYFTGIPDDAATNTLYHLTPEGTTVAASTLAVQARLQSFYQAIDDIISKVVVSPIRTKMYNMADPEPRLPVASNVIAITTTPAATNLPEEVALCLSFQATPISGASQASRRGRIFIGPLSSQCITNPTGQAFPTTTPGARTLITNAARAMADTTVNVATWVVYSPTTGQAHPVSNGWLDVQFDTQRRRGNKVVGRDLWTAP